MSAAEEIWDDVLWDEESQRREEAAIEAVMRDESIYKITGDVDALYPSEFAEFAIKLSIAGGAKDFSFVGREYLRDIYDCKSRQVLLKCGRQTEKCGIETEKVLTPDGSYTNFGSMKVGDEVVSLSVLDEWSERFAVPSGCCWPINTNWRFAVDEVVATKTVGETLCKKIITRMGSELIVSSQTPILTSIGWKTAGDLSIYDRVAAARSLGSASKYGSGSVGKSMCELVGILIADGYLSDAVTITKFDPAFRNHIVALLERVGNTFLNNDKKKYIRIHKGPVTELLDKCGLRGKLAAEKFIPDFIFLSATFEESVAFLRGLWSCDGSIIRTRETQWDIVYASTSKKLASQVRYLLTKFGVPSRLRANNHAAYRDDPDKDQYLVRVETIEGVRKFLELVGKGSTSLPEFGDSNRDVYPKNLVDSLIRDVCKHLNIGVRAGRGKKSILKEIGLRVTPRYNPSRSKLNKYIELFSSLGADCESYNALINIFQGDIIWDSVVSVDDAGVKDVVHIETKKHHNFLHDNIVTHNSTMLGNLCLTYSALNPAFKTLYVSATAQQAQVFSTDRIKDPIETSEVLSALTNRNLSQNVFFKQFTNRSQIRLRYAFLSADRVRGIPADNILIDEIQDILADNIPVIEECASHSEYKLKKYSGTPKSLDNTIEVYWQRFSTQNEWMVPCDSCNNWNELGENNIGKRGVICAKCGKPINVRHERAQWASMQPVTSENEDRVVFEGFRIPQIMVPWIVDTEDGWSDILMKLEQYSRAKFYNEVLGLSFDSGSRPLKRNHIKSCCRHDIRMADLDKWVAKTGNLVFMGCDWGCHDDKTRVLTSRGFKLFSDLQVGDLVAQFDKDTREMTFVEPYAIVVKDWEEPLYHVTGRGIDMMLTGTHRMLFKTEKVPEWRVQTMSDFSLRNSDTKIRGWVDWNGEEMDSFILPGLPSSPGYSDSEDIEIPGDLWLEFLGYALSEGGLCYRRSKLGVKKPHCIKMSQRWIDNDRRGNVKKISSCLNKMRELGINVSEFFNPKTCDYNWSLYGKQLWDWWSNNIGTYVDNIRIPRQFINVSKRQLRILFDALMLGDGSSDKRDGNENGVYYSTSLGLCEDFQEICVRLGYKSTVKLSSPANGNRKSRYRTSWSKKRDLNLNWEAMKRISRVPYKGKVYCCSVPSGFIVTERNGCIAYQGNSGEQASFTVVTIGGYIDGLFTIFFAHRFTGKELEPPVQLDIIAQLVHRAQVKIIGSDYGGGFDRNDFLQRTFGRQRVLKYQWAGRPNQKLLWQPKLGRFIAHRTEVMSDVFNAVKRRQFRFPNWEEFKVPYAEDMLNIFSEYNEQLNMTQYKHSPGKSDDTMHSMIYCFLASMLYKARPDILIPSRENDVVMPE